MRIAFANLSGPMAGICYKEYIPHYSQPVDERTDDGADVYYVLTEGGELHEIYIYEEPYEDPYGGAYDRTQSLTKNLGKIEGVSLPGVSGMQEDATASMLYDAATQKLVVVSKIKTGPAKVQVIDPITRTLVMTREFTGDVRRVGILYQYDYSRYPDKAQAANAAGDIQPHALAGDPGSVQTHEAASQDGPVTVDKERQTVSVDVRVDGATNGLTTLTYDPKVLTFSEITASAPYHAACDDPASGTVKFAFAGADVIETATAHVTFTYQPANTEQTTTLTFQEKEKGNPKDNPALDSWTKEITLPGNATERTLQSISVSKKPTQTEYVEGTTFNDAGMELTLTYDNGDEETIDHGWEIECDLTKPGTEIRSGMRFSEKNRENREIGKSENRK